MTDTKSFHEVHDTRRVYRSLLDGMARPGKLHDLSPQMNSIPNAIPLFSGTYALGRTLLDAQTTFYLETENNEAASYLELRTGSRMLAAERADYLFIETQPSVDLIRTLMQQIRIGTLLEPEKSATLIIRVRALSDSETSGITMTLSGPGIKKRRTLSADGFNPEWLRMRAARNMEYPTGCDFILISDNGQMAALPRTTMIESEAV
ncbi:phosphonate C-P lyase system protein PhnH [Sporolactobacillus terrae]|uniref:phosphonate C-P lyase system protein PhnH n=1 Tax=Sporolactobacillus terrae TaxID=269673 RepID=UPI00111BAFD2|nr:phosphonate C-P lyase system protein PhnH [Sporolactobacillus terrae]